MALYSQLFRNDLCNMAIYSEMTVSMSMVVMAMAINEIILCESLWRGFLAKCLAGWLTVCTCKLFSSYFSDCVKMAICEEDSFWRLHSDVDLSPVDTFCSLQCCIH